jgi:hypothetical protein
MKLKRRDLMAEVKLLLSYLPVKRGFPGPGTRVFRFTRPFSEFKAKGYQESDGWGILVGRRYATVRMAWRGMPVTERDTLHLAIVEGQPIAIAVIPAPHAMVGYASAYAMIGILTDLSYDSDETAAATMHVREMIEVT